MEKPAKTLYTEMNDAKADDLVTAYHVCHSDKSQLIQANKTAGGVVGADPNVGAPSESECIKQVTTENAPWAKASPRAVIEFGVNDKPGYAGGSGYVVAVFSIQAKYLRKGSGSERGWCAYAAAPIVWLRQENV